MRDARRETAKRESRANPTLERLAAVHSRQVLTYLRLLNLPLGLLMNFRGETFCQGVRRVMNDRSIDEPARRRLAPSPAPA
jgi:hypothetical protein